jgi:hypothetical protein
VKVLVDGEVVTEKLDGRAIEVDPGEHVLRLEPDGEAPMEQTVLIREAERERSIVVRVGGRSEPSSVPPSATAATSPTSPHPERLDGSGEASSAGVGPWPAYVAAGVGGVALASFAWFALSGISARSDLASCKGDCDASAVDAVHRKFIVADISLGISIVALGIAAYLLVTQPHAPTPTAATLSR